MKGSWWNSYRRLKENVEKWDATNMSPLQVSLSLMANCSAADTPPADPPRSPWEPGGNNRAPGMFSGSATTLPSSGRMAITESDVTNELKEGNISESSVLVDLQKERKHIEIPYVLDLYVFFGIRGMPLSSRVGAR